MEPLPPGLYTVIAKGPRSEETFESEIHINRGSSLSILKFGSGTPSKDQIVSGVGLIRGWACQSMGKPGKVEYQIDGVGDLLPLPYGSQRSDTASVCPKSAGINTGYGGVVNWNSYSPGNHVFTLYIDGEQVKSVNFRVAPSKGEFLRGLRATSTIEDFPSNGDTTTIEWSEPDQNFTIIDIQ